jgi:uncharacterized protein (TIGR00255 family)
MTGFAAASQEDAGQKINVTLKAVNHRFLDIALKMPHSLAPIESRVKSLLQQRLTRGSIEVTLFVEHTATPEREVVLDDALLDKVAAALASARARGVIAGELSVTDALRLPQVLEIRDQTAERTPGVVAEPLAALAEQTMAVAIEGLIGMRDTEGGFLAKDLEARVGAIAAFVDDLERLAREGQAALEGRLRERLAALTADLAGDPVAVAQEVVRFVSRSDIDEELVRLRSHVDHWRGLAEGAEPCGRKLDFLVQEMNREINTIGSKVEGAGGTEVVIAAKAELERIKEQVQNVE